MTGRMSLDASQPRRSFDPCPRTSARIRIDFPVRVRVDRIRLRRRSRLQKIVNIEQVGSVASARQIHKVGRERYRASIERFDAPGVADIQLRRRDHLHSKRSLLRFEKVRRATHADEAFELIASRPRRFNFVERNHAKRMQIENYEPDY